MYVIRMIVRIKYGIYSLQACVEKLQSQFGWRIDENARITVLDNGSRTRAGVPRIR